VLLHILNFIIFDHNIFKMTLQIRKIVFTLIVAIISMAFSEPEKWFKAGTLPDKYRMELDKGAGPTGNDVETIQSLEKGINGFGTLMQKNILIGRFNFGGKRVRMTGLLRSKNVKDWAGFWMRVDQDGLGHSLAFDNMSDRAIKGTTGWKKYEIVLDVPKEATALAFGALLSGSGQIWFDDINFEVVDSLTSVTAASSGLQDGWFKQYGKNAQYKCTFEASAGPEGKDAFCIESDKKYIRGLKKFHSKGSIAKQIIPDKFLGKRVRTVCYLKSEKVSFLASLNFLILTKDPKVGVLYLGKTRAIKRTRDWKKYEVVFDVPESAAFIKEDVSLCGSGKAWFNFSEMEIVDKLVPVTFKPQRIRQ
jgi:hypothetical protein